jgi:hypothetical protein
VAFKHPLYPDLTCDVCGEERRRYGSGSAIPASRYMGPFMEIVAEFSHMYWLDITGLQAAHRVVLDRVALSSTTHTQQQVRKPSVA